MRFTILLIATAAAIKIEEAGQYPTNGEPDFEKWCDLTKGEPSPDTCDVYGMAEMVCKQMGTPDAELGTCAEDLKQKMIDEYENSKEHHEKGARYPDFLTHCDPDAIPSAETCTWGTFVEEVCN